MKGPELPLSSGDPPAATPLIVSAGRAADIPAFHAEAFMRVLRDGCFVRTNPFNRKRGLVSFSRCRFLVFWSKNPAPLFPYLSELRERGFCFYMQFTLNDYEREKLEPGLPPLEERTETFMRLAERIGRERVIWRFDPLTGGVPAPDDLLERVGRLAETLRHSTEKLVFSFLDIAAYARARARLRRNFPLIREPAPREMLRLAGGIAALCAALKAPLVPASCAEKIDLSALGIGRNRCIDGDLLLRLCRMEEERGGASFSDCLDELAALARRKDAGQRGACGCIPAKDIGGYGRCPHLCAYCYARP
jgi:hypothetical protein